MNDIVLSHIAPHQGRPWTFPNIFIEIARTDLYFSRRVRVGKAAQDQPQGLLTALGGSFQACSHRQVHYFGLSKENLIISRCIIEAGPRIVFRDSCTNHQNRPNPAAVSQRDAQKSVYFFVNIANKLHSTRMKKCQSVHHLRHRGISRISGGRRVFERRLRQQRLFIDSQDCTRVARFAVHVRKGRRDGPPVPRKKTATRWPCLRVCFFGLYLGDKSVYFCGNEIWPYSGATWTGEWGKDFLKMLQRFIRCL